MSLVRPLLNTWLRLTEKPHLRRVQDHVEMRRSFEAKARLFFHAPRGTQQSKRHLGGRPVLAVQPPQVSNATVILYLHGGGYVFGSPRTHAAMIARLCKEAECRAILPDYRKAPEHPFPAGLDDALAAYLELLSEGEAPENIVLGGDSAGGGLALALLVRLLSEGHPLPAGLFSFSPLTDLTYSGASVSRNAEAEVMLPADRALELTASYIGTASRDHPWVSPLFADFTGAPPIWLTVGSTEILLDDSRRLTERLKAQRVNVSMQYEDDLPHVWPIFHNTLPEARATLRSLANWINAVVS